MGLVDPKEVAKWTARESAIYLAGISSGMRSRGGDDLPPWVRDDMETVAGCCDMIAEHLDTIRHIASKYTT